MQKRYFDFAKDYATIQEWWRKHGSFAPKPEHLSTTGFLIETDKPLCAGFLYKTDSKICVFEFVVSNPDAEKNERQTALDFLIEAVKSWAREQGFSLIYTSVKIPSYVRKLAEHGFIEADTNQTHMFYQV